jgi:hypothetical protein
VVRREGRWFGLLGLLAAALLLAVAATVGLVALLAVYWPSPRLVSQVGLFAAGMLALGAAARPRLTTPLAAAAALAALGFVFVDNRIVADQIRLNRIEQLLANRVIARLEQSEGFADVRSVVIASRRLRLLDRVRSTHDLNVSPFFHRWSRQAVLNLVGGFDFEPPSDERLAAVEAECERLPKWPHRDSIRIDGREAVVCLP